jgi:uncharacterized protein
VAAALLVALVAGCQQAGDPTTAGDPTASQTAAPTDHTTGETEPADPRTDAFPSGAPDVPALHPDVDGWPEAWVVVGGGDGATHPVAVKVADTDARRRQGLMQVPELPAGTGMLFVFDRDRTGGFWMKDTLVPLDIAFVDAEERIVAIRSMDPCASDPCDVYEPGAAYRVALEVPQGWFAEQGIDLGDRLSFRQVPPQQ